MSTKRAHLDRSIRPDALIALDTSALLAYLGGGELTSGAAATIIDGFVASGRNRALVSAISVTEALVRPFRAGSSSAVGTVEAFLSSFPNLTIAPVSFDIAREAARIRAATALRTPDSLILATAVVRSADVVVANDRAWERAVERARLPFSIVDLASFADGERSGSG